MVPILLSVYRLYSINPCKSIPILIKHSSSIPSGGHEIELSEELDKELELSLLSDDTLILDTLDSEE